MRKLIIVMLCCMSQPALAQFSGFPLTNHLGATWYEIATDYHPVAQYCSGVVEVCEISGIEPPEIVNSFTVQVSTAVSIITNSVGTNVYVITNTVPVFDSVVRTNAFSPFVADIEGTNYNIYPTLTWSDLHSIDERFFVSITNFVSRFMADTNDTYEGYLESVDGAGDKPGAFPMENLANLCSELGIGYVTNRITNEWGHITGGRAGLSYSKVTDGKILLVE